MTGPTESAISTRFRVPARLIALPGLLVCLALLAPTAAPLASAHHDRPPAKSDFRVPATPMPNSIGGVSDPSSGTELPLAASSPGTWSALPNFGLLNGPVLAVAAAGNKIFVGGQFNQTNDGAVQDLNGIAMFDLTSNTWSALPHRGLNGLGVRALIVYGGALYLGGDFSQTFDGLIPDLNGIARFDLATNTWSALPSKGFNSTVSAFVVSGSDLYVGGDFTFAEDGTPLNHIARYNGGWSALPNQGLNFGVSALAVIGTDLYVGGWFTRSGDDTVTNLNGIAALSGGAWSALPHGGVNGTVEALTAIGSTLYVGGGFNMTADSLMGPFGNIASYVPALESWSALPDNGLNGTVLSLTAIGTDLYAGGTFAKSAGVLAINLSRVARYSPITNTWSALPNGGLTGTVYMVAAVAKLLYAGGTFSHSGDNSVTGLNYIAKCCYPLIEVNQALGDASGRYVAGKDTAIIVYPEKPTVADAAKQNVVVKRNNVTVTTLFPQPPAGAVPALIFKCPSRPACGDWQAGTYSFDATINGSTYTLSNVAIVDRRRMQVLAVPVKTNYGGTIRSVSDAQWKYGGQLMRAVYPVAWDRFSWQIGGELNASTLDVTTEPGRKQLWQALANLQPRGCTTNCYDKIIGFIPDAIPILTNTVYSGYTYGDPANVVAINPYVQEVAAHEVGHTFGLGDEYDALGGAFNCSANPPPAVYTGIDWFNRDNKNFHCVASPALQQAAASGTGGRVVAAQAHSFDIRGRDLLNDMGSFMGNYQDDRAVWVSPDAWRQIFDGMAPNGNLLQAAPATPPVRVVQASGFISHTGQVSLEPWFSFTTTQAIAPITSTYQIEALSSLSATLATQGFNLSYNVFDEPALDNAPFNVVAPFPAGTAAFRIISGTQTLAQLPVLAHSPLVTVTAPAALQVITNVTTISWIATHPDGAGMVFNVEYNNSSNDANWVTLVTGITNTQWAADSSVWGGSAAQSRVRITASDGVNGTSAQSASFSVPLKAPEPSIQAPISGTHYLVGQPLTLDGIAFDWQDSEITNDSQLVWSSSRVPGTLGIGHLLTLDSLPLGKQTIALSATNSVNQTAVVTITVTIDPLNIFLPDIQR